MLPWFNDSQASRSVHLGSLPEHCWCDSWRKTSCESGLHVLPLRHSFWEDTELPGWQLSSPSSSLHRAYLWAGCADGSLQCMGLVLGDAAVRQVVAGGCWPGTGFCPNIIVLCGCFPYLVSCCAPRASLLVLPMGEALSHLSQGTGGRGGSSGECTWGASEAWLLSFSSAEFW